MVTSVTANPSNNFEKSVSHESKVVQRDLHGYLSQSIKPIIEITLEHSASELRTYINYKVVEKAITQAKQLEEQLLQGTVEAFQKGDGSYDYFRLGLDLGSLTIELKKLARCGSSSCSVSDFREPRDLMVLHYYRLIDKLALCR